MTEILYKELSYAIVGTAMEAHRILGPGFLKAVYETALAHELTLRGIRFETQKQFPVRYKGQLAGDYIADFKRKTRLSSNSKPSPDSTRHTRPRRTITSPPLACAWLS